MLRALFMLTILGLAAVGIGVLAIVVLNLWIVLSTRAVLADSIDELPYRDVAIVLGTVPHSEFLNHRIEAAAALYHAGKIGHLLVSGYREDRYYDEPAVMRAALLEAGIPDSAITTDRYGLRTLDSIHRARHVYGVESCTIVSQKFHNHRAVLIARRYGMSVSALNAPDVALGNPTRLWFREIAARCAAILDLYIFPTSVNVEDPSSGPKGARRNAG